MCLTMGEGIAGRVAQTGEPILVEDISRDPEAARPDLIIAEGLRGFISVPLKAKDKVLGVMNIASHLAGEFAPDDMYLLNSIACQLGTAIEQAELYKSLNDAKKRYRILLGHALTIQEQERKRIATELHDDTSQQLAALPRLPSGLKALVWQQSSRGWIGGCQRKANWHFFASPRKP